MDNVVFLDHQARELDNLRSGTKTMIIRAKARVKDVFHSEQLTKTESEALVKQNQHRLLLDSGMLKRFSGKRYIVFITIESFQELEPFKIDRSQYGNMDDWLPVEDINSVKI